MAGCGPGAFCGGGQGYLGLWEWGVQRCLLTSAGRSSGALPLVLLMGCVRGGARAQGVAPLPGRAGRGVKTGQKGSWSKWELCSVGR